MGSDRFDEIAESVVALVADSSEGVKPHIYAYEIAHALRTVAAEERALVAAEQEAKRKVAAEELHQRLEKIAPGYTEIDLESLPQLSMHELSLFLQDGDDDASPREPVRQFTAQELCNMEGDAVPFAASPRHMAKPTLESVKSAFERLSDEDREAFMHSYCSGCGGPRRCQCQNDE